MKPPISFAHPMAVPALAEEEALVERSSASEVVSPGQLTWHADSDAELNRWQTLIGQVGRELAEPMTAALHRIGALTSTGRISKASLRALHTEVERVRQTGILCQQIARLSSGQVQPLIEPVHVTHTLQSVLAHKTRDMQARGLQLTQSLLPLEVRMDASMLFGLLSALIDWWLSCAHGVIDLRIDTNHWPMRARLSSTLAHHPPDQHGKSIDTAHARVDTMPWHLLAQTSRAMGLVCKRLVDAERVVLTIEFPNMIDSKTAGPRSPTAEVEPLTDEAVVNAKPLLGNHVLVVVSRRDLRLQAREALKGMGVVLDFASSVREAVAFCQDGLPDVIVFESALRSVAFERWVVRIRQARPHFAFIELADEGRTFDLSTLGVTSMARVGQQGMAQALPAALVYAASRMMSSDGHIGPSFRQQLA